MTRYLVDLAPHSEGSHFVLERCPICQRQIVDTDESSLNRDEMAETVERHILQHDPDDLGLDEYQFRPMADILLELYDLGRERKEAL